MALFLLALKHLGKLIGLLIGYLALGFAGSLLGFFLGWALDKLRSDKGGGRGVFEREMLTADTSPEDFIVSAMILASSVVNADGRVSELELTYIRRFFVEQFGNKEGEDYLTMLERISLQEYDLASTGLRIRRSTGYEVRLQILYFLFGIADSNYEVSEAELKVLQAISIYLDIDRKDFLAIQSMYRKELNSFYKILEINPSSSDEELRQSYRHMAQKFHPDKLAHLGRGVESMAKDKFQRIRKAYEEICKVRGIRS